MQVELNRCLRNEKLLFLSMSVLLLQMKQDELEHLEALVTDFLEISPRE